MREDGPAAVDKNGVTGLTAILENRRCAPAVVVPNGRWPMLQRGDQVPHFTLRTLAGHRVNYSEIWQRRSLLLICLPAESTANPSGRYVSELAARAAEIAEQDAESVVTSETVTGAPCPGVVVADRWGEIYFVAGSSHVKGLPSLDDLLAWLRHIRNECPECQGEAR